LESVDDNLFLIADSDGKVTCTDEYMLATKFRMCKGRFIESSISFEYKQKWLRHHSWRLRIDPIRFGQSFSMDASWFPEDPMEGAEALVKKPRKRILSEEPSKRQKRLSAPKVDISRLEELRKEKDEMGAELKIIKAKYMAMHVKYDELKRKVDDMEKAYGEQEDDKANEET
jgi:hypothetical protein